MSGNTTNNPFYIGVYGGEDCYAQLASEQLDMVQRFSLAQCQAALRTNTRRHRLRKSVVAAIQRRIKRLVKNIERANVPMTIHTIGYECPQCNHTLRCEQPDSGTYDTMVQCPACEWLHHRRVTASGKVTISIQEATYG